MYGTANSSNTEINKVATDFARATYTNANNSNMKDINGTSEVCSWFWLRSAKSGTGYSYEVWYVYMDGKFTDASCHNPNFGFSPAFVVDE